MKPPFHARAPTAFNAHAVNATIRRALASAGLDTTRGPLRDVTETIQRALAAGKPKRAQTGFPPGFGQGPTTPAFVDVAARRVSGDAAVDVDFSTGPDTDGQSETTKAAPDGTTHPPGSFETHAFSHDAGSRTYKLYVPAAKPVAPRPMLVMLHGCTQSADDFAAGTRMNRLADEHGLLVVYPEQAGHANTSKCWNWFKPQDQQRGAGEPALLAALVAEVARQHDADPRRIYVAGLSAGAAMAVVLGETYPELFAGVGAHSGLPYASAHDMGSALAAMKGKRSRLSEMSSLFSTEAKPHPKTAQAVPVIVFHGDRDHTVQHCNSVDILQQAQDAYAAQASQHGGPALNVSTQTGVAAGGRRYTRTVHTGRDGHARLESWTSHGAGHAWSGGDASGSYTESRGPDASAEMLRFFMALPGSPTPPADTRPG